MAPASRRTQESNAALRSELDRLRAENERLRAGLGAPGLSGADRHHGDGLQGLVSSVLATLLRAEPGDMDERVQRVLGMIGAFAGAGRARLLEPALAPAGEVRYFSCQRAWSAGDPAEPADAAPARIALPAPVAAALGAGEPLVVDGTDPSGAPAEGAWPCHGACAAIAVPMLSAGELVGVLELAWWRASRAWSGAALAGLGILGDILAHALVRDRIEAERLSHLRYLEDMARVNAAMEGYDDLDAMLAAAMVTVRDIFHCERVFVLHPCHPDGTTVRIAAALPPDAPEAVFPAGQELAVDGELAEAVHLGLTGKRPVTFGPGQDRPLLACSAERGVQLEMWTGLPVKIGVPWLLGVQRCAGAQPWEPRERDLLGDMGRRVADAIGTLLSARSSRANEERFRSLLAAIPDLIFVFDAAGRYREIFPMQHNQLVRSSDELRGQSIHDVLPPGVAAMTQRVIDQAIVTGELQHVEYALDLPGGKRWFSARTARFDTGDDPCVICVARDITERRNLEEQLLQAQKMESVGRLAGGVAHDFNNLLTAVLAHAELAMEELPEESDVRQDLGLIHDAASRGAALTRQLLTFARKQVISPRVVNLNDLLLRVDAMLRRLIGAHIEFVTVPEPNLHTVRVDPVQFEQVLVNLAINARDAMPGGGKLVLATSNMVLHPEVASAHPGLAPGAYVVLTVTDTGVGMDEDTLTHIFEPFFTTKETGKGTGLGLATCYGIVKQCGGDLWVTSKVGAGSTFKVVLPRVDGPANSIEKEEEQGPLRVGSETVLVVEDEPTVRAVAVRTLRRYGYRVIEAANGDEALAVDPERLARIDLLLTDVVMPRMSGRQLAEQMRTICPTVRVLYVSGYTDDAVARHPMLTEGVEFLQKPFTPVLLARKVRELLDAPAGAAREP